MRCPKEKLLFLPLPAILPVLTCSLTSLLTSLMENIGEVTMAHLALVFASQCITGVESMSSVSLVEVSVIRFVFRCPLAGGFGNGLVGMDYYLP